MDLDKVLFECHIFQERNRDTFDQVVTDVARLGETIADLERLRTEATEDINAKEQDMIRLRAEFYKQSNIFFKILLDNRREMMIRKNDLAVFQFMMQLTKCKSASSLMQESSGMQLEAASKGAHVCETAEGLELNFQDKAVQAQLDKIMTPSARQAIRELLEQVQTQKAAQAATSLKALATKPREEDDDDEGGDGGKKESDDEEDDEAPRQVALSALGVKVVRDDPTTVATTTTLGMPTPPVEKTEVVKRVDINVGYKICKDPHPVPDCGLLHDRMSILWGKYKDLVDELQQTMDKNWFEFEELKEDFMTQLQVMRNSKARFIMQLNEVVSNLNAARVELSQKEALRITVEHEYRTKTIACHKEIEWLLFQDICPFIVIRGKVMKTSTKTPPEKIVDCDWDDWVAGECSKTCDNRCKQSGNYDMVNPCGGMQTMTRNIITWPEFGLKCPPMEKTIPCGQVKCPVDCEMSEWSGWSKCTRECEGGVKGRTRNIITQPEHGGLSCNTVNDEIECNTGTCDRDCSLKRWSKWTPCSTACDGGTQEKYRRVTRPIRGKGKCPKETSRKRLRMRACNTHACNGDEICIARQDLIMSIDGSGSVRKEGFDTLKEFAATLAQKYQGQYHGYEDMRIGVVQFGNGEVVDPNTNTERIADALEILPLTNDMAEVKKKIEALTFQKGFTNMAQAFGKAEKMFMLRGRRDAMSAVMTLTDGKPSFLFQTHEKVQQLKDKHVQLFFAPVVEFKGDEFKLMKKWASQPWQTNLVRIPGLDALAADGPVFAQKLLVKFCPNAISPSATSVEEKTLGFMLVREEGICGAKGRWLTKRLNGGAADCAALAEGAGFTSFALGIRWARGRCRAMNLKVTADVFKKFKENRANPTCDSGWKRSRLYDFYAIIPVV